LLRNHPSTVVVSDRDLDSRPSWNEECIRSSLFCVTSRLPLSATLFRVFVLLLLMCCCADSTKRFTNKWAVQVPGGEETARRVALEAGFLFEGHIIADYYSFVAPHVRKRSPRQAQRYLSSLQRSPEVEVLKRVKRDFLPRRSRHSAYKTDLPVSAAHHPYQCSSSGDNSYSSINDPEWPQMWYLNRGPGLDHNVKEAWDLGYTGKNVVVTILDDGLERTHPDIAPNYDPSASYDINDRDSDPLPRYEITNENRHGTRCAGEVAAVRNNTLCIVGIAHGAKIGGIRMLDGEVTDSVEAASLSLNRQHIDIYSASWGPEDDGKTVDGPGRLASVAIRDGANEGRGGKGSIFVWASGNGGRDSDSCNCDGYTNSIYTLSISSASENGRVPWYSEACSSTLATTYSSGEKDERMIVTTDLHHACIREHTGTSASAPLAAGICALTLEANPNLTWRDM
uniref:Furin-like protease 1 n=1 Tax=Soboliphyme baturini TaxID=241478 RepID=A0A183IXU1_9BILA